VTKLLDRLLYPDYLVTATQAIEILPGESPQPLHYDDSFCTVPRPRQSFSVGTIWCVFSSCLSQIGHGLLQVRIEFPPLTNWSRFVAGQLTSSLNRMERL